ncbi:TetR/AcrR family transcriptional regulator [Methylorubrum sp. B1-46]|mgnify:CR=1 FL=1|uniref:TetR/AcrR family transcriptional regulator n=1 Tax=Methylorubrum sp. B1-46 TaxID=2897334 RepID=UPI0007C930AC|nr:TetR/AcrR family transcriptional regulator [Methylorubrum sp. B1-46]OAH40717.1 TetR family transcriptional regulator [Methylorubrum populi]UGB26191.1 TetR/AcrR family transcriptional regulator [Methylorubrum sp. B1-46]
MGRTRTIDRDKVLDHAEQIVRRDGATALTFDAVAKAAGITKGGLQYCFGDKDGMIAALIERWFAAFDAELERSTAPGGDTAEQARGYVAASSRVDEASQTKMVGMLVTLLQSPEHLERVRVWYAGWIGKFDPSFEAQRRARTAFFAAEGAFFLRSLGLVEMDQAEWDGVFADFLKLL